MKKLNYFLLGAAALTLASCSNEDLVNPGVVGDGNYNITVKLPADMGTRALSDGLTADVLRIAVYDADDNNSFVFQDEASFGGAIQTTVSLNLPQGKTYKIAFFAVSEAADGTLYNFDPEGGLINVDYENAYKSDLNLADDYDCFYYLYEMEAPVPSTPTSETVTLYRPVAQINWGTNDLSQGVVAENAFGPNGQYLVSNFEMADAYTQFSLLDSDVTGTTSTITLSGLASPASNPESATWAFPVNPAVYKYIAMQYVLAPKEQELFTLSLDAYNNPDKSQANVDNEVINVSNAPVQANYRTNIYGSLLTNPNEFTVIKDPNWETPDYDPSLELAIQRGGYFTLEKDYVLNKSYIINNRLTINLNGHSITNDLASDEGIFYVVEGGNLTITGDGNYTSTGNVEIDPRDGKEYPVGIFVFVDGGTATIEGGNYVSPGPGQNMYCLSGTLYIKGGKYQVTGTTLNEPLYYPINCYDSSYDNGTANIIVTGGSFYNFNPADNMAEKAGTNFVAKGYKVVTSGTEGNMWYTVAPDNTTVTNDVAVANEAASKGEDVLLNGNISNPDLQPNIFGQNWAAIVQNGGTIDGGGNTLNVGSFYGSNDKETYGIYTSGGTIKNLTITNAFRGIYAADKMTQDLVIDNCVLKSAYTFNTAGANYKPYTFTANNTDFYGWTTWSAFSQATFNNCNFYNSVNWGATSPYRNLCRPYITTTFNNCNFAEGWQMSIPIKPGDGMVTFTNCYVGGVKLTQANAANLFSNIELYEGVSLNQVATFN